MKFLEKGYGYNLIPPHYKAINLSFPPPHDRGDGGDDGYLYYPRYLGERL